MARNTKEMNRDHPRQVITPTPGWIKKNSNRKNNFSICSVQVFLKDLINGKI
jgi:hypothetical protein